MPQHNIKPVFDAGSRILVLGSFPSVKSRETQFFYGHPQNRFWRVLAAVLDCPVPGTVPEKRDMLLQYHVAIWDVIASCKITGSSDASIRDVVPNDLTPILQNADIRAVFTNGAEADRLYRKYLLPSTGRNSIRLPSTSPANAAWSVERLTVQWQQLRNFL